MQDELTLIAYTTLRLACGAFFAISGYHKLFNSVRHAALINTLRECGIPFLGVLCWVVPTIEFAGGIHLLVGFNTPLAASALGVVCLVACVTDGRRRVASYHPIDPADRIDDWLYLPEVWYVLVLLLFVVAGPGEVSIDQLFNLGGITTWLLLLQ